MLRDVFRRLGLPGRRDDDRALAADQPRASIGQPHRPEPALLARIERLALDVYADHGLPTRPGHFRWNPRARTWTFLGEDLTPERRWALLQERPTEAGWRYGRLSDLGRTGVPDVAAAAAVLDACARLRNGGLSLEPAAPWEEMELAIRLGAQWQALENRALKAREPRLRLTAPDAAPPAAAKRASTRRRPPKTP